MRTILSWYQTGGPFMTPIAILGVGSLILLFERIAAVIRRSKVQARAFIERVVTLTRSGKVDEALKLCVEHESLLPDMGLIVLRSRSSDEGTLRHLAEAARLSAVPTLTKRVEWV